MTPPDDLSSLCFLDSDGERELARLIDSIRGIKTSFNAALEEGSQDVALILVARKDITEPDRNPHESPAKYEADFNTFASKLCTNMQGVLSTKWDTCQRATDHLFDLMEKQKEVKAFLAEADKKKPDTATHQWKVAAAMPRVTHTALQDLHSKMEEFAALPIERVYGRYVQQLASATEEMSQLRQDQEAFCKQAIHKLSKGDNEMYGFQNRADKQAEMLDRLRTSVEVFASGMPDLYETYHPYRLGIYAARRIS